MGRDSEGHEEWSFDFPLSHVSVYQLWTVLVPTTVFMLRHMLLTEETREGGPCPGKHNVM